MFMRKNTFPMIPLDLNSPPSRNARKPTMFGVTGRSRRATSVILFCTSTKQIKNTAVISNMMYLPLSINVTMKS